MKFGVDLSRLVGESARSGVGRQGIAGTRKGLTNVRRKVARGLLWFLVGRWVLAAYN